jgi:hypothetical protein
MGKVSKSALGFLSMSYFSLGQPLLDLPGLKAEEVRSTGEQALAGLG